MVARIDLDLAHAYGPKPQQDSDYALLPMKMSLCLMPLTPIATRTRTQNGQWSYT